MPAEWYLDFIDLAYNSSGKDLVALFRVEPAPRIGMREAVG
ncbi:MAG TPA: hypothetical protein EYP46_03305 [Hadesarchaea archaeon]|nr:hypothetical protein [Hadesarchaea archaeon]